MTEHGINAQPLQHELEQMAADTFETMEDAAQWLRMPHPMLNGEAQLQIAKTHSGAERVRSILTAIKYGGVL